MKKSMLAVGLFLLNVVSHSLLAGEVVPIGGRIEAAGMTKVMTVTRVDQESREVALSSDGVETTFIAGPEVRNLAQVEVGDKVSITHAEAMAVRVYPVSGGAKGRIEKTEISRAPLGAKPYGMITRHVEITGQVAELDRKSRKAVLEGKHGSLTLRVAEDVDLSKIVVKDRVRVDYLERISIQVDSVN